MHFPPFLATAHCMTSSSLRHRAAQYTRPEECPLRLLNDLLIHALWRVIHHDGAGLVIDLRVDSGVANEVDDPFFAFVGAEGEAG